VNNAPPGLSFSLATYLAYLRIPASAISETLVREERTWILPGGRAIVTDDNGFWRPNYFGAPGQTFPVVSFLEVMDQQVTLDTFTDKIVMVGIVDGIGTLDTYTVPSARSSERMSGIEIHAHAVETLLQDAALRDASTTQTATILIATVWLGTLSLVPMRWYFKILMTWLWIVLLISVASLVFASQSIMLNLFDPILALMLVLLVSMGSEASLAVKRRQRATFVLDSIQRIARQRLNLERATPYIKRDLQHLVPGATQIEIQFWDAIADMEITVDANPPDEWTEIPNKVVIPLVWQGALQGVITIEHPRQRLGRARRQRLGQFIAQLRPSLNNIALYHDLQQQKHLLDTLYAEAPVGLAVIRADGTLERHNSHLKMLLGDVLSHPHGHTLQTLLRHTADDTPEARRLIQNMLDG
ncbi:MAG: CHASE2 domain-containing protein, partial [Chloroflexota bacterium]